MNQSKWKFFDREGLEHLVGVMHSPRSGNLMIYCDDKVIQVDFKVFQDNSYSFFINEELFEIFIKKKNGRFQYEFEHNVKVDTPNNRIRKKINKRNLILGSISMFFLVFAIGFTIWYGNYKERVQLAEEGINGKATAIIIDDQDGYYLAYKYGRANDMHQTLTTKHFKKNRITENGMPLENGDEFYIRYVPHNPQNFKIDFKRPTTHQIAKYKQRAINKYLQHFPDKTIAEATCAVELVYIEDKINALADFYFQNFTPKENKKNNINSFQKRIRAIGFKKKIEKCLGNQI